MRPQVVSRENGEIFEECVLGGRALNFAYRTLLGRSLWCLLFNHGWLSGLLGRYYDSPRSLKAAEQLLKNPGFHYEESEYELSKYHSFNDFFARRLKAGARPFSPDEDILCSPADGRVLIYEQVSDSQKVPIKGVQSSLNHLCCGKLDAGRFYSVLVVRLAPVDYHRFHYPCDCRSLGPALKVAGKYHSVNPVAFAKAPDLFVENTRQITKLVSDVFGEIYFLEVGAFGVGSIVNTAAGEVHRKMAEKGFFKFGGSTVILILEADKIVFSEDLRINSGKGLETLVRCGETVGIAAVSK